jgi:hypothetical protein
MFPQLSFSQQDDVVDKISEYLTTRVAAAR